MTMDEARDLMFAVVLSCSGDMPIVWSDFGAKPPIDNVPWARVILRHTGGGQTSLSGEAGARRFSRSGIILIQLFTPIGRGQFETYPLAQKVANAFEDSRLDVWFRNIRIMERGTSGSSEQIDVLADFSYDEVR